MRDFLTIEGGRRRSPFYILDDRFPDRAAFGGAWRHMLTKIGRGGSMKIGGNGGKLG